MALNLRRDDITAGYNFGIDSLNKIARDAISGSDKFIDLVLGMKIDERVDFNDMNYEFMKRLMEVNINEHEITLSALGDDAHLNGDSTAITGQAQRPFYSNGMNYLDEFATTIGMDEKGGLNTTRSSITTAKSYPYKEVDNLYPDELNSGRGKDFKKWNVTEHENKNSILYKTKKLFNEKKINTIISKFGTAADGGGSYVSGIGDASTIKSGMSHGKNLLQAAVEKGNSSGYNINGYNNPYCRVWTHHYQYDRLDKLIRPFTVRDENGNSEVTKLEELHTWDNFKNNTGYGWKNGKIGWDKSVLDDNGFVKIAPKFGGGGENNVHTKDCMFSIENLAWKGYDPYSFEQALSWEQRGPFGGRIMWFPPYGLTFNETTQTNWSSNTFIGRGEDVYTYVNTVRSGTLSFIMLTDHPSVIDYANWYDGDAGGGELEDTDILRFFAGCDSGKSNGAEGEYSIYSKVKPTPLTDEYIKGKSDTIYEEIPPVPKPEEETPEKPAPDSDRTIQFYVFYPNNYSGCYDLPNVSEADSRVHSIGYLLFGRGCNKMYNPNSVNFGGDMPLGFDLKADDENVMTDIIGAGYEMTGKTGISVEAGELSYIAGSKARWEKYEEKPPKYIPDDERKWFYRIDGKYEVPQKTSDGKETNEMLKNTYDQILSTSGNYKDNYTFGFNLNADAVKKTGFVNNDEKDFYSLAEVAAAIAKGFVGKTGYKTCPITYSKLLEDGVDSTRVEELCKLLFGGEMELVSISLEGYSNSHGSNPSKEINDRRNELLAAARANTVKNWLKSYIKGIEDKFEPLNSDKVHSGYKVKKEDLTNVNGESAKLYRSTKVVMTFSSTKNESLAQATSPVEEKTSEYQKFPGFRLANTIDGVDWYVQENSNSDEQPYSLLWYEDKDGILKREETKKEDEYLRNELSFSNPDPNDKARRRLLFYGGRKEERPDIESENKLRYDQEYHFFKRLEKDNPIIFEKLTDKLKYFDPAFHSMTPEGFNARLTFLQQCTRQGNTVAASDPNRKTASNLGFGRPPFCVLRIGDFYYQTIVIESVNIDYNVSGGLQWDLNPEGAGVQPMLAQVNISFKFIGGGDLGGPIRRLQNAMTFNYYSNSRLFDNRTDRITYKSDDKTQGALDHSIISTESFAYSTKMAD